MIFNYENFSSLVHQASDYNDRFPYPYAIFDDLFDQDLLYKVNQEFEDGNFKLDTRKISSIEVKTRSNFEDNECIPRYSKQVFDVLNGGRFLNIISSLTGIDGLISDPYFDGGGLNLIKDGGTLAVHVDGTHQKRMNLCRRLNAILFINENWDQDWNGYHEQWIYKNKTISPTDESQDWECIRKIAPKFNRLLIFTTNDHSWHGHAGELRLGGNNERRSLITYLYTVDRPSSDLAFDCPHRAIFIKNKITLRNDPYTRTEVVQ